MTIDENRRAAATVKVGISSYVGNSTLAVLAGQVAIFTYVQANFEGKWWWYLLVSVAVVVLVASIVSGGVGSNQVANGLADGAWDRVARVDNFDRQASLTLVGLVFVLMSTLLAVSVLPRHSDGRGQTQSGTNNSTLSNSGTAATVSPHPPSPTTPPTTSITMPSRSTGIPIGS